MISAFLAQGAAMKRFDIALIPGDGIGREVVPAGQKILDVAGEVHGGFRFRYKSHPWSCAYYLKHGRMMPAVTSRLWTKPLVIWASGKAW